MTSKEKVRGKKRENVQVGRLHFSPPLLATTKVASSTDRRRPRSRWRSSRRSSHTIRVERLSKHGRKRRSWSKHGRCIHVIHAHATHTRKRISSTTHTAHGSKGVSCSTSESTRSCSTRSCCSCGCSCKIGHIGKGGKGAGRFSRRLRLQCLNCGDEFGQVGCQQCDNLAAKVEPNRNAHRS